MTALRSSAIQVAEVNRILEYFPVLMTRLFGRFGWTLDLFVMATRKEFASGLAVQSETMTDWVPSS